MTRDQRVERLHAIGAASFREGDLAMARAILEAVESVTGVAAPVPSTASPKLSQREYEREKKRRQRDKSRDSVPVSVPQDVPGHVPGDNAGDMSPLEGVGGGLISPISSGISLVSSLGSVPKENTQNPLRSPNRAAKTSPKCECPPASVIVDAEFEAKCVSEGLPDPHKHFEPMLDIYAKNQRKWAGVRGWRAAYLGVLRRNLDKWPAWAVKPTPRYHELARKLGMYAPKLDVPAEPKLPPEECVDPDEANLFLAGLEAEANRRAS